MNPRHPVLFVSHGAPDVLLQQGATGSLWAALGQELPRPRAILVVSAHWQTRLTTVLSTPHPETIHDFGRFPPELFRIRYPAPGATELAGRVIACLHDAGLFVMADGGRGLDHGAWVPLTRMYPAAEIPVAQCSICPEAGPAWHRQLGEALRPLRDEGVLILASGAVTHNFAWLRRSATEPHAPAVAFANWLGEVLEKGDTEALLDYRRRAPFGAETHPTEDHLLPLFVAWGASGPDDTVLRLTPEYTYGGLAMDAYVWHADARAGSP